MAIGRLTNPTLDFTDYSLDSSLSDEELVQHAVELSLAETEHPPDPLQDRLPPPPPAVQSPANPHPRANPLPISAHPPFGNPVLAHRRKEFGALHSLIVNGDLQALTGRIRSDPNSAIEPDSEGWIALHEAASFGQLQCLKALLEAHPATLNKVSSNGQTPLLLAVGKERVSCVEYLLQRGADPNLSNNDGESPLFRGVDPNIQVNDGATPLYEACKSGHVMTVEMLLSHKADANLATRSGRLPIHIAVQKGHTRIVSMLIPVTRRTRVKITGLSPLHIAAELNRDDILEILIEAGYDVNAELSSDRSKMYQDGRSTVLYFSVANLNYEAAEMLLEAGANPNVDAFNPLLIAVRKGCVDMVTLLLQHGANVNASISTHPSRFPSAALLAMPSLPMLKVLLDNGCDARACFDCVYGSQPHPPITPSHHHNELRYRVDQPQSPLQFCEAVSDAWVCSGAGPVISLLLDYVAHVRLCSRLREHLGLCRDGAAVHLKAMPPHPLMQLCRLRIRQSVGVQRLKHVNNLPLPGSLVKFLNYDVQNSLNE